MNSKSQSKSIYLLPFFIFFTVTSISLLQSDYGGQVQRDSSVVNQITLSVAYGVALLLLMNNRKLFFSILGKASPLLILLALVLISAFWSSYPGKVVISFVHNVGSVFVALCMVILLFQNKDAFLKLLLLALFFYIVATISVTLLRPDIGVMTSSNIYAVSLIGRWRGLTNHPNSLGSICLFTTWVASSSLFFSENKNKFMSLVAIIALIGNFYCLYKTNSMTSSLLSFALVTGMLGYVFISQSTGGLKYLKIFLGSLIIFVSLMMLYILHPELFSEKLFFRAIGRDSSLSGRSSLWEMGFEGFALKPYFGWSYDSLRSFLMQYKLGYGTLHNGYLDLLVRGGLVSMFFFSLLLLQLFYCLIRQALRKDKDYVLIAALLVAVLMHNMTEASFFCNTNLIWLMFLVSYLYSIGFTRLYQQVEPPLVKRHALFLEPLNVQTK